MKIGIIDADLLDNGTRHPNLALMKLSGYHKSIGNDVSLLHNYNDLSDYDVVHVSKVFSFTKVPASIYEANNVVLGGTGFYEDGGEPLRDEIEHYMPDYTLYDEFIDWQLSLGKRKTSYSDYMNYSIGFTSRGCFRKCEFCVNKKYDRAIRHSYIDEFLDNDKPYIYLWDDNFLAFSGWREVLDELIATNKPFQFRQGLDIRLMTEEKAKVLSNVKYHGDYIFAFDHISDREMIEKKLKLWKKYTAKTTKLYVLCAYESQDVNDVVSVFERVKILMKYGCLPYIMRYEDYKGSEMEPMYVQLARWCNQPNFFKKKSFRQFCIANQDYHKTQSTNCAAYQAMLDFEAKYPEVAAKYFDMRYEDINEYMSSFGYGRKYAHKNDCDLCHQEQKKWLDAYHGLLDEEEVIRKYFIQEMDLQCLTLPNGACSEVDKKEIVKWFINLLENTKFDSIIRIIKDQTFMNIMPANIPQISKVEDAIFETVRILHGIGEHTTYSELGYYLDGKNKKDVARKKYGENHSKLATLLDLVEISEVDHKYKITTSLLGESYITLDDERKKALVSKLMLRIPMLQHMFRDSLEKEVMIEDYMICLSETTLNRRKGDIYKLVRYAKKNVSEDEMYMFNNIGRL